VGINDPAEGVTAISISPVPARDKLQLTYQTNHAGNTLVRVFNTIGQELRTIDSGFENTGVHKTVIDLRYLSAGVYMLEIKNGMYTGVKRFVKE
jgi:hypothetical protein